MCELSKMKLWIFVLLALVSVFNATMIPKYEDKRAGLLRLGKRNYLLNFLKPKIENAEPKRRYTYSFITQDDDRQASNKDIHDLKYLKERLLQIRG